MAVTSECRDIHVYMAGAVQTEANVLPTAKTNYADTPDTRPIPWRGRGTRPPTLCTWSVAQRRRCLCSVPGKLENARVASGESSPLGTRRWSLLIWTIDLSCDALRLLISKCRGRKNNERGRGEGELKVRGSGRVREEHNIVQRRDRVAKSSQVLLHTV